MSLHKHGPVVWAYCCRQWPVVLGSRIGRCGICGERPRVTDKRVETTE